MSKVRSIVAALACCSSGAMAATDFGIRALQPTPAVTQTLVPASGSFSLAEAAAVGARYGLVTSTWRSAEHNRRVGGVANSYHLRGRAIDIARRAGVRHYQIEQAMRLAGFSLVESLDEGDHSHFAFRAEPRIAPRAALTIASAAASTQWRVVVAPR
ncbi:MAG: D-Ala-D-Ala carboxypeptidase family metallohydrolase [Sphingomicrobium sp.]